MAIRVSEVLDLIESHAPAATAESWDNVGLLVGSPKTQTTGAVLSIDLTDEAIELAKRRGFKLIINHHPCLFPHGKGLSKLNDGPILQAARAGIAVVSIHTNFDRCALEVVDAVASGLGLEPKGRLFDGASDRSLLKLITFVPRSHLENVRTAVCEAGAGVIGLYDQCTFASEGMGTYRPSSGTRPFRGKVGRTERTPELKFETVFPAGLESQVLRALRESHPYEEVAFDLVPLRQVPPHKGLVRGLGYGFWGEFSHSGTSKTFSVLTKGVKRLFRVPGFWMSHPWPRQVRRVAFAAGKGTSVVESAIRQGCDLMITGEVGYHAVLSAARRGLAILELGHTQSECFFAPTVKSWIKNSGIRLVEMNSGGYQRIYK